jgi:hypothetical protein
MNPRRFPYPERAHEPSTTRATRIPSRMGDGSQRRPNAMHTHTTLSVAIGVCKVNKKVRRPIKRSADDTGRVMRARPLARKRRHAPAPSRVPPHGSCPGAARSVCSGPIDRPEHARGQAKVTSQSRKKLAKGPHGTVVGVWALDGG